LPLSGCCGRAMAATHNPVFPGPPAPRSVSSQTGTGRFSWNGKGHRAAATRLGLAATSPPGRPCRQLTLWANAIAFNSARLTRLLLCHPVPPGATDWSAWTFHFYHYNLRLVYAPADEPYVLATWPDAETNDLFRGGFRLFKNPGARKLRENLFAPCQTPPPSVKKHPSEVVHFEISRAEAVRRAVAEMLGKEKSSGREEAFGAWTRDGGDSAEFVRKIRKEWDE